MGKYSLSNKAINDLTEIWEYTFDSWSESQADKYYHLLLDACQDLADGNLNGKSYGQIKPGIFGCKVSRHIIFYQHSDKSKIQILRILHDRMDLRNQASE